MNAYKLEEEDIKSSTISRHFLKEKHIAIEPWLYKLASYVCFAVSINLVCLLSYLWQCTASIKYISNIYLTEIYVQQIG